MRERNSDFPSTPHNKTADLFTEPAPRLDGAALLARTEARLHTFCTADERASEFAPRSFPLTDMQCEAIRDAAAASSGPGRLCAVADILEVSPYFSWFTEDADLLREYEAREKSAGRAFIERLYRAFDRLDLVPGMYCREDVGLIGPDGGNEALGVTPLAACADAIGWAALLWGHPDNRWDWEHADYDPGCDFTLPHFPERYSDPWIAVHTGVVGLSFFVELARIDAMEIDDAAGRIFELDPLQVRWLRTSGHMHEPHPNVEMTAATMAAICRAIARGEPREKWKVPLM